MERITFTTDYAPFAECDFVVENATEKEAIKKTIYPVIDEVCPPHAVFAANTSCISITRIGSWTGRPDRVLGMHFMNPVPLKPVVETIRGTFTTQETIDTALQLLAQMGKEGIVVNDYPGFVSTGDLIGLDTILYSLEVLYESYNDSKFRPCPLLRRMVDAGLHGRKSGKGFFDYSV
jgi:3-hydroxybutyryl-CoA dehydrogenase